MSLLSGLPLWLSVSLALAQSNSIEVRKSAPSNTSGSSEKAGTRPESVHLKPSLSGDQTRPAAQASPWDVVTTRLSTSVTALKIEGDTLQASLTLAVEGDGRLRAFALQAPPRLVVEGDGLTFASPLGQTVPPTQSLVTDFRFGPLNETTGRLVFDLARPARLMQFERTADDRLTLKLASTPQALATQEASDSQTFLLDLAAAPEPPPRPTAATKRPLVLIDAGHGGKDPGAVTAGGIYEKDVVLAVAMRLEAALVANGRYDVRLTRRGDISVTLDRRVAISRRLQPDLFISLHADTFAGQPQAAAVRGGSVYILADQASNRSAAVLADKENAADLRLGPDALATTGDAAVDGFLSDLTQRETQSFAANFQGGLVKSLRGVMQLAREPARGAAFKVLKQAGTPAVLIELGYMSHAQDITALQAPEWQGQVAAAVTRAIDTFFAQPRSLLTTR